MIAFAKNIDLGKRYVDILNLAANAHAKLKNYAPALSKLDEVIRISAGNDDLQTEMINALASKGRLYYRNGDFETSRSIFLSTIEQFSSSKKAVVKQHIANAINQSGDELEDLGEYEFAITLYDKFLSHYSDGNDEDLQLWVATTLINKANAACLSGNLVLAQKTCEEILQHYGESENMDELICVANSQILLSMIFQRNENYELALNTCSAIETRFGHHTEHQFQFWAVFASIKKAELLLQLGKPNDSLELQSHIEKCLIHIEEKSSSIALQGIARITWIKCNLALNQPVLATKEFQHLFELFDSSSDNNVRNIINSATNLVNGGANVRSLVRILEQSEAKPTVLEPLIIALKQNAGENVRAPEEVLKIATDIRSKFAR